MGIRIQRKRHHHAELGGGKHAELETQRQTQRRAQQMEYKARFLQTVWAPPCGPRDDFLSGLRARPIKTEQCVNFTSPAALSGRDALLPAPRGIVPPQHYVLVSKGARITYHSRVCQLAKKKQPWDLPPELRPRGAGSRQAWLLSAKREAQRPAPRVRGIGRCVHVY